MRVLIFCLFLLFVLCDTKYDGEIVKTSKGEIIILHSNIGSNYTIERIDTLKLKNILKNIY